MNYSKQSLSRIALAGFSLLILLAMLAAGGLGAGRAAGSLPGTQSFYGRFEITWGDGEFGQSQTLFTLTTPDGQNIPLQFEDPLPRSMEELIALRGQPVRIEGAWMTPSQPEDGINPSQIFPMEADSLVAAAVSGSQPWVSLLCKFSDIATEPKTPFYFQDMYRSTYPGMDHHWREQSFDLMNVLGSDSTNTWYTLPNPRSYYVYDSDGDGTPEFNFTRATTDCTAVANAEINFPSFVGINMMFNSDLDGYAWGGSRYMTLDGLTKTWYTTWEPPWGYDDITVIAHEMGHGFGLPHSSGEYGQTYDNRWDVMSDTWTDCGRLTDPTFGCLGQHTISYHKDREGWVGSRQVTVALYSQATVILEQLALPQTSNPLMVKVPINGSTTLYYTVEVRRNLGTGYDIKLPASAVIIHEVNTGRSIPAHVKDADGNGNTGDAGAQWLPGETFSDAANNITITINSATATGFVVTICNACSINTPTPSQTPTLTPTRTPTKVPVLIHVGDLDGSRTISGSTWTAYVTFTVHDQNHNPVPGAMVSGSWSKGANGSAACTTDVNGQCTVSKYNLGSKTSSVTFTVKSVSKSGCSYQSTANHDPDSDSTGTRIVVYKT